MKTQIILIVAFIACACNERVSITPQHTNDDNWSPDIRLGHNNYQRVELILSQPPDLQIYRNLTHYIIHANKSNQPLAPIDTVELPYNGAFRFKVLSQYISPPVFEPNKEYVVFVAAQYQNGVTRMGSGFSFVAPPVPGKVLRQIPRPPQFPGATLSLLNTFGFGRSHLYVLMFDNLYSIDPCTGAVQLLLENLKHPVGFPYRDMVVRDSTAFFSTWSNQLQTLMLASLHLSTLELDYTWNVNIPDGARFSRLLCHDGGHLYLLWGFDDGRQIAKFEIRSRRLIETFSKFENELLRNFQESDVLVFADNEFWIARSAYSNHLGSFDNRLSRFDLNGRIIPAENRNPIFATSGLAWDGGHFWVFDRETNTFAQLELEGL
jgi:hypothetical protein